MYLIAPLKVQPISRVNYRSRAEQQNWAKKEIQKGVPGIFLK